VRHRGPGVRRQARGGLPGHRAHPVSSASKANNLVTSARDGPRGRRTCSAISPPTTARPEGTPTHLGHDLSIAGLRFATGDYLILLTDPDTALDDYARAGRSKLSSAASRPALSLEDTHLTRPERVSKLIAVLALTFFWAHRIGEWLHSCKPSSSRSMAAAPSACSPRLGLLRRVLLQNLHKPNDLGVALSVCPVRSCCLPIEDVLYSRRANPSLQWQGQ